MRRLRARRRPVDGAVAVPGSKSIANRALVIAALAEGESTLVGLPDGDDTVAMQRALAGLGVEGVAATPSTAGTVVVAGTGGTLVPATDRIHTALAGTTSRFVTALAALADGSVVVDGDAPLRARPMGELHAALGALGAGVRAEEAEGRLPVELRGPLRTGGTVTLRGDVSSQFVSALMMIGPYLAGGLRLELTSPLVSVPYVELTARVMADFGLGGVDVATDAIVVPEGRYLAREYVVEPDASSASYPLAIAAVCGGTVRVPGLTMASPQGDVEIASLLARMGCDVLHGVDGIGIHRDPATPLLGLDADLADVSDLVPTVAAAAAVATTPTTLRGVGFIRAKESDRLGDLAAELGKAGADVTVTEDGLQIEPVRGEAAGLHGARLDTHHDHRLAMAFAVLGTVVDGIEVADPDVVSKSWPGFWAAYDALVG